MRTVRLVLAAVFLSLGADLAADATIHDGHVVAAMLAPVVMMFGVALIVDLAHRWPRD